MTEAKFERVHLEIAPGSTAKWNTIVELGLSRDQFTTLKRCLTIVMPHLELEAGSPSKAGELPPGMVSSNATRADHVELIQENIARAEEAEGGANSRTTITVTVDELHVLRGAVRFAHGYDKAQRLYSPDAPDVLPEIGAVWEGLGVAEIALNNGFTAARQTFAQYSAGDDINQQLLPPPL